MDHRTVGRELEHHLPGLLSLHPDRLPLHAHRLPAPPVAILVRVLRIGLLDVQVLLVDAHDREAEGHPVIVPGGHPGEGGLARADHVPPRPHEVNEVAQAGEPQAPVGVVGEERLARGREGPVHHPVVAPLFLREAQRRERGPGQGQDLLVEPFEVDPGLLA
jgi:hypothetical protein